MKAPIGIFDSGVGGLTVFDEIAAALPDESLIYLGDSARVPYGTKSPETVSRYALEAGSFLLGRGIKAMVVACNTATAAALPLLRERLPIPVIGVIDPGARAAVAMTRGRIGVIATEATVRSGAYGRAIRKIQADLEVVEQPCPLFVPLAEEGWANTRVAHEVAEIYLRPLLDGGVDTLVLGCTHYPLLKNTIRNVAGDAVALVDSAETTAEALAEALDRQGLLATDDEPAVHQFLVTDAAERFRKVAEEFLDRRIENIELVNVDGHLETGGEAGEPRPGDLRSNRDRRRSG